VGSVLPESRPWFGDTGQCLGPSGVWFTLHPSAARQKWSANGPLRAKAFSGVSHKLPSTWPVLGLALQVQGEAGRAFSQARFGSCQKSAPSRYRQTKIFVNTRQGANRSHHAFLFFIERFYSCQPSAIPASTNSFDYPTATTRITRSRSPCARSNAPRDSCSSRALTVPSTSTHPILRIRPH
jgi:hypothetical protein